MVQPAAFDYRTDGTANIILYFPAGIPGLASRGCRPLPAGDDRAHRLQRAQPGRSDVRDVPSVTIASTLDQLLSSATLGTRNTTTRVPSNLAWATVERSVTLKR